MKSELKLKSTIEFPEFTNERIYMQPFEKNKLPKKFNRWKKSIDTMLKNETVDGTIYLTIDQSFVKKGSNHRRSGLHFDGNFVNNSWDPIPPRWSTNNKLIGGGILLASNEVGCKAYVGEFHGEIKDGGNCEDVDISKTKSLVLKKNFVYLGNVHMLHETMAANEDQYRTFIRLTLPPSYRF